MKSLFLLYAICLLAIVSHAQVLKKLGGDLKEDAKWKLKSKANQKMDQALDTLLSQPKKIKGKQKTKGDESVSAEKPSQVVNQTSENNEPKPVISSNESIQVNGIVGDWKLSVETYDENQNKKLDPQEKAKAFSNHFFFRFNADGSALVNSKATADHAFKAKYKLSKRKDLQFLSVYIDGDDNESPDGLGGGYYIISVDKNELVLLEGANERAIWIFKRS